MLFLSAKGTLEECRKMSEEAIVNGAAFKKLIEMVEAQGGDSSVLKDTSKFARAPYERKVLASVEGYITHMNTEQCGISSLVLGAGREKKEDSIDYSAGIVLNKKVGDYVKKGELLASLYTSKQETLEESERILLNAIKMDEKPINLEPLIFARIEKDKVEKFVE
jgi:pyrimidine-nucleoside phosphorylase